MTHCLAHEQFKVEKGDGDTYFFLPLILGLIGLFYQVAKDKKNLYVLVLFFFLSSPGGARRWRGPRVLASATARAARVARRGGRGGPGRPSRACLRGEGAGENLRKGAVWEGRHFILLIQIS